MIAVVRALLVGLVLVIGPLAINPPRIFDGVVWLVFATVVAVAYTQPRFPDVEKLVVDRADRSSAILIVVSVVATVVASIIEYAIRNAPAAMVESWTIGGATVMLSATVLRIWAIRTLGRFFTSTVVVRSDHQLVETGPYKVLRHPSYTGVLFALLGIGISLRSVSAAVATIAIALPAYVYRVRVEEAALIKRLGNVYEAYRTRTWALIPFVY